MSRPALWHEGPVFDGAYQNTRLPDQQVPFRLTACQGIGEPVGLPTSSTPSLAPIGGIPVLRFDLGARTAGVSLGLAAADHIVEIESLRTDERPDLVAERLQLFPSKFALTCLRPLDKVA